MDQIVDVATDSGMLILFDPERCSATDSSLITFPFHRNAAVRDGVYSMFHLPGDGVYRLRLTTDSLPAADAARAHHSVHGLGLEVVSGQVYVSGNDLPGSDADDLAHFGGGTLLPLPNGSYLIDAYLMAPSDDDSEPDLILVASVRTSAFVPVTQQPILLSVTDDDMQAITDEVDQRKAGS